MALNNLGLGFIITAKDAASSVFQRVKGSFGEMNSGIKEGGFSLQQAIDKVKSYGAWMEKTGDAGISYLKGAASQASAFTKQLKVVSSAAGATNFPVKVAHDLVVDMSTTYGSDLMTQAKAVYSAIRAGATSAAEATAFMTATNKLAIASQSEVGVAASALTKVIQAYGMSFADAAKVGDKFAIATRISDLGLEEMSGTIGRLAVTAKSSGVSMDDMLAAITTVTKHGMNASEAMMGLRTEIASIQKPSKTAAAEAKRLGIEFDAAALRQKGLVGVLASIGDSANFTEDSLAKLFGTGRGFSAVAALLSDRGMMLKGNFGKIANSAGALDQAFKDIGVSAKALLAANMEAATVLIGEVVKPVFDAVTKSIAFLVNMFVKLPKPIRTAMVALFGIGSVLMMLVGSTIAAAASIAGLVTAFAAIGWEVVGIALAMIIELVVAMGAAMAVTGAIAYGFYAAIKQNIGGIGTFLEQSAAKTKLAFEAIQSLFDSGSFSGALLKDLNKAENSGVKAFAITVWLWAQRVWGFIQGIGKGFQDVLSTLGPVFSELVQALTGLGNVFGIIQDKPGEAGKKWEAFSKVGTVVGRALGTVFGYVVQAITWVISSFNSLASGMTGIGGAFSIVWSAVKMIVSAFMNAFDALSRVNGVGVSTGGIWKSLGVIITGVAYVIAGAIYWFAFLASTVMNAASAVIGGLGGAFSGVLTILSGVFDIIKGMFAGDWSLIWQGGLKVVAGFAKAVVSMVLGLVSVITSFIDSIAGLFGVDLGISKAVSKFSDNLTKGITNSLVVTEKAQAPIAANKTEASVAVVPPPSIPVSNTSGPATPSPAAASAAASTSNTESLAAALNKPPPPPPPINITTQNQFTCDGQVLADIVEKYQTGPRSFNPTPTPA